MAHSITCQCKFSYSLYCLTVFREFLILVYLHEGTTTLECFRRISSGGGVNQSAFINSDLVLQPEACGLSMAPINVALSSAGGL